MGWTYTNKPKGTTLKEFFASEFTVKGEARILDVASVGWAEAYAAFRTSDGRVIGMAIMTNYRPKEAYYNFGYKELEEFSGPYITNCPERILKLLTPLDPITEDTPEDCSLRWAHRWRAACWAKVNSHKGKTKDRAKLTDGCTIRFAEPIGFTDGSGRQEFYVHMDKRKVTFHDKPDCLWLYYKISKWREREYTVVG